MSGGDTRGHEKVDGIVVCPVGSKGIGPAIEKANAAGIPVFTADIRVESAKVVSQIASDNIGGGRLAAQHMARFLAGRGEVAIIDQPVTQTAMERVHGFLEEIATHRGIRVVARLNGDGVRDRAMKAAEDLLQRYPNLSGIFGINDDSALGALAAVEASGRKGIVIVGYDGIREARQAIASPFLSAGLSFGALVCLPPGYWVLAVAMLSYNHSSPEAALACSKTAKGGRPTRPAP